MMKTNTKPTSAALLVAALMLTGCGEAPGNGKENPPEETERITNRIDVPSAVRRNLGITFAKVERRDVANTIRVPGSFEIEPEARRAYAATLSGHVELLVTKYQRVKQGDVLFRVNSPEWREMQASLSDTMIKVRQTWTKLDALEPRVTAAAGHVQSLKDQQGVWQERLHKIDELKAAGSGVATARTEARAELAALETALARAAEDSVKLEGERETLLAELAGMRDASPVLYAAAIGEPFEKPAEGAAPIDLALARAAALLDVTIDHLRENVGTKERPIPRWRVIDRVEVSAHADGVVEALGVTDGAWLEVGDLVLKTVDPKRVHFHAVGLQSDLADLRDGMKAVILPPGNGRDGLLGRLTIGLEADPLTRKIDLLIEPTSDDTPHWARNGISAEVEIELARTPAPMLAIPRKSIILDGLERVIFRRDPKDEDKVIRMVADLGMTDGRWVVVESGVMEGDEVVLDGIYELMLASGGTKQAGGHFHADGTFHAEDH